MVFTPEGKNYDAVKLAGDIMRVLTAPKGLWVFEGSVAAAQTQIDYSGNGNTATSVALGATEKGFKGNCPYVNFPTNNSTKYFSIDDAANLSFGNGAADSAFSVFALVYLNVSASSQNLLTKWGTADGKREWNLQFTSAEKPALYLYDDVANKIVGINADDALTTGAWYFIVGTYDGGGGATAADGCLLYSNGVSIAGTASNQALYDAMDDTTSTTRIGAEVDATNCLSPLGIVGVTGEELSAAQIWKLWVKVKAFYDL